MNFLDKLKIHGAMSSVALQEYNYQIFLKFFKNIPKNSTQLCY